MKSFPFNKFDKSCLIYTKGSYGIFLLSESDDTEKYFVVKIKMFGVGNIGIFDKEENTALYIKENYKNMPNILVPEDIYIDQSPINYSLFTDKNKRLKLPECKDATLAKIFTDIGYYSYYLTKAGLYNLGYYLGTYKGRLSYRAFVGFSFQLLAALLTLHDLGVWHGDIKPQNILVANKEITSPSISYKFGDKVWTIQYSDLSDRDLKIIDYGNSEIMKDVENTCDTFKYEVSIAVVSVIQTMWNKTDDKESHLQEYEQLIQLLKNCKTKIIDVISSSEIYKPLEGQPGDSYLYEFPKSQ
jgi:serine/threonine protein kinase